LSCHNSRCGERSAAYTLGSVLPAIRPGFAD